MSRPPRWLIRASLLLGTFPLFFILLLRAQLALGLHPPFPDSLLVIGGELMFLKLVDPFFLLNIGASIPGGDVAPWILFTPVKILFWFCVLLCGHWVVRRIGATRGQLGPAL